MDGIRRVCVMSDVGGVAAVVVDRDGDVRVEVGPVDAMRRRAEVIARSAHLVAARADTWERRTARTT